MKKIAVVSSFAILVSALSLCGQTADKNDSANAPFRNPELSIEQRVNDLVSRLTIEEKAAQMVHTAPAIPRLGIPAYNWWSEGLHGAAREGYATVFPQAIGLAATFDPDLLHKEADVIATEFRVKYEQRLREKGFTDWYHGLTVWSPNINIFRDPRWGRGQETYGEDPFLTAQMGTAYVTGLQGDGKYFKALSTPKHFAVHSGPESTRHSADVVVSNHDLEDTYLPAFRATVTAGAGSVMCAYNSVDGKPACAQPSLLQDYLRDAWHFEGYVVSDCGAASDISEGHHYTQTMEQGVAAAVKAGMDIVCGIPMPDVKVENAAILQAVKDGLLSTEDVDRSLRRLFTARFKLGMFDPPSMVPYHPAPSENDSAPHRELALTAARESLVLLKNSEGVLPLQSKYKTIAVIGPNADSVDPLLGNYNGTPTHPITVLAGMRKRFGDANVLYAAGSSLTGQPLSPIPAKFLRDKSGEQGLNAEYFTGTDLRGKPADTHTDLGIDFSWQKGINSEMSENFSVRWTGSLVPPVTGDYQIGFTGTDAFHIWLDNQLIGESRYSDTSKTRLKTIHLEAGHAYPIRIECSQEGSSGIARLVWHEPGDKKDYTDAVSKADLIIAVLGLAGELEGEEMPINVEGFSGGDRTSLDLPRAQEELLKDLVASGKPVVVVLMNGSALAINWAAEHAKAILEAWYPGEEGGTAVAEALAGDFSPGGRLPLTFYKSVDQLPAFDDYNMKGRTYRYFTGEPLYPFGYGLSYTSFGYSNLHFDKESLGANDDLTARVDVKNTGTMAGDEVVEVYVTHPSVEAAPARALAGFKRIRVTPGATEHVQITVTNRQLSVVDGDGTRKVVPGELQVWVGEGQPATRDGLAKTAGLEGTVKISGEAVLPK
ncbi:MAG TPA: glycoside hydrolase family 3 C-terminal domain-containing protein [Terriglobales bacterium]|nr:glycoside hydrolase family 3 C-terminal domain-containing protein [Terriglobales bacterium]